MDDNPLRESQLMYKGMITAVKSTFLLPNQKKDELTAHTKLAQGMTFESAACHVFSMCGQCLCCNENVTDLKWTNVVLAE